MSRPDWIMAVPVLNTVHLPGDRALHNDRRHLAVLLAYEEGWFVKLNDEQATDGEPEYLVAIREWFTREFGAVGSVWIRFDADGDTVDDLPTFEADWEETQPPVDAGQSDSASPAAIEQTFRKWHDELTMYLQNNCPGEPPRVAIAGARTLLGEILGISDDPASGLPTRR